jgi:hypothetical protein
MCIDQKIEAKANALTANVTSQIRPLKRIHRTQTKERPNASYLLQINLLTWNESAKG